jgi:hypothetical protein
MTEEQIEKLNTDFMRLFRIEVERRYGAVLLPACLTVPEAEAMSDWLVDQVWPSLTTWPTAEAVVEWLNAYRGEHSLSA